MNRSPISFLFGSGLSRPAEYPSMSTITSRIITGDSIHRNSVACYALGAPSPSEAYRTEEYIPKILFLLEKISELVSEYYCDVERTVNYEDLYYISSQIRDSKLFEYENPAIIPLNRLLTQDLQSILGESEFNGREWTLKRLSSEASDYIVDIVWQMLKSPPKRTDYLTFLEDIVDDEQVGGIDIFTLNHDTLLELYFGLADIPIADGFPDLINHVRYLDLNQFSLSSLKVKLYKLHGSINWFTFDTGRVGIPESADIWHTRNPEGILQRPTEGRPMFLAGTVNKILNYSRPLYFDLHCFFRSRLSKSNNLVVVGYSFNDKAINTRIIDWLRVNNKNRMIVIHPRPDNCKDGARYAIRSMWDHWSRDKQLLILQKSSDEISYNDFKQFLTLK